MMNIQSFCSISAAADRVLVDENSEHGPTLKEANYTFKDRAVFFLANIPLLKDTNFVKSHLNKLDLENKAALGVFLGALSKCYGTRGALAAAEALKGPAPSLNAHKIRQLSSIAQDLCGRGNAKALARQAVVRIWPNAPGCPLKGAVGHASITVKNKMSPNFSRQISEHISWWPTENPSEGKKNQFFGRRGARSLEDYKEDRTREIGAQTVSRLKKGEDAKERLRTGQGTPLDRELAKYIPRSNQMKDKDGDWGVIAQKVYLPLVGKNAETNNRNNKSFTFFGLNERRIIADAQKAKSDAEDGTTAIGYTLASKEENCAAMVARMLKSGGAENFETFNSAWIFEDPNKIHAYAKTVQSKVDELNIQADNIGSIYIDKLKISAFKAMSDELQEKTSSPFQKEIGAIKERFKKKMNLEEKNAAKFQIEEILDKQTASIELHFKNSSISKFDKDYRLTSAAKEVIFGNAPSSKDNFDTLMEKAKKIVRSLDSFLKSNNDLSGKQLMEVVISGWATLDRIKDFIEIKA